MENVNIKKIELERFEHYVNALRRVQNALLDEIAATNNGLEFIYFVDFSEIRRFCFPGELSFGIEAPPWETNDLLVIRERLALWTLFTSLGKIGILPSHRVELLNFIKGLNLQLDIPLTFEYDKLYALREKLVNNQEYNNIKLLASRWNKAYVLNKEEIDLVLKFVANHFGEFKINLWKIAGIKLLKKLVNANRLVSLEEYFPEFELPDEDFIKRQAIPWFDALMREKSQKDRAYQNYMDALACVYLEQINRYTMQSADSPRLCVFASRSSRMLNMIDNVTSNEFKNHNYRLTRNLDSLLFSNLSRQKQLGKYGLANLSDYIKNAVDMYDCIGKELSNHENDVYQSEKHNVNLSSLLKKIKKLYEVSCKYENLILFESMSSNDQTDWLKDFQDVDLSTTMSFLKAIVDSNGQLKNEIKLHQCEYDQDIKQISTVVIRQYESLHKKVNNEFIESLAINESAQQAGAFIINNLRAEYSIELYFHDSSVIDLVRTLIDTGVTLKFDNNKYDSIMKKIFEWKSFNGNHELHFLEIGLMCAKGSWKEAMEHLDSKSKPTNQSVLLEYYHLKTIILRKLDHLYAAIESCQNGIDIRTDARMLREKAVLIWKILHQNDDALIFAAENLLHEKIILDTAIWYAISAEKFAARKDTIVLCLNTLAFLLAERGKNDDFELASQAFKKLEDTISKDQWSTRFMETKAFLLYKNAELDSCGIKDKIESLQNAIIIYDTVLDANDFSLDEINIVKAHRFNAHRLLISYEEQINKNN